MDCRHTVSPKNYWQWFVWAAELLFSAAIILLPFVK